jgi:hypothetical protein
MNLKDNAPLYLLTASLLAVAVYLKSPVIAVAIVALWGVHASEAVFTRKNRDADIVEMQAVLAAHKAKMDLLSKDITNVAERAKTILGDVY